MTTYGYFSKILNDYVKQEIKEIMKKEIFRVGDKVFHIDYGWGVVIDFDAEEVHVTINFKEDFNIRYYELQGVSFTEYTLQGFTQERPIVLPEVGELCLVRDSKNAVWKTRNFKKFTTNFLDVNGERWEEFKRIKILD